MPVIPAPKKTIGNHGEVRKVDLSFLAVGTTTRQEVQTRLGWSDVGLSQACVFWGRWRSSSALDLNRWGDQRILWRGHNILVEFDDGDRVKRFQEFGDKDMVAAVKGWLPVPLRRGAAKTLPREIVVRMLKNGQDGETRIELREESLNFEAIPAIPLRDIRRLSCTGTRGASEVRLTLRFTRSGIERKKLDFFVEIPEVVTLLDVLQRKRPDALR
jgi:hypothetical protein